jgi:hypothetical protein
VHLVGFIIRLCHDARSHERQIHFIKLLAVVRVHDMNHSFLLLAIPEVKWLDLDPCRITSGWRVFQWEAGWTLRPHTGNWRVFFFPEYWGFICQLSFPQYSTLIFIVVPFLSEGQAGEVCRLSNKGILVRMWGSIRLKSNFTLFQATNGYNECRRVVKTAVLTEASSHSSHTTLQLHFPLVYLFSSFCGASIGLSVTGLRHHTHGIRHTR